MNMFEKWIQREFPDGVLYVHEIETETLESFKNDRLDEVTATTVNSNLLHIQSFFSWLHRKQYIENHPFENLKLPKPSRRTTVPNRREWEVIKDQTAELVRQSHRPKPLWIAIWMICRTGMRLTEVVEMKWERGGTDYGDGHSRSYIYLDGTTAVIYLKRKLRRVPMDHIWNDITRLERDDNLYLFESPSRPGKLIHREGYSKRISDYLTALGFDDYTAHSLRHAFITELVRNGHNMTKISRLVGHSSESLTERYTHLRTDDFKDMLT